MTALRPTREQVDEALSWADKPRTHAGYPAVLAAEVRAQRAELDAARAASEQMRRTPMTATTQLVQTLEYVTVETSPAHRVPTYDDSGLDMLTLSSEWKVLPARYRDVLAELIEADPGAPVRCYRCLTQPVGYADETRENTYGAECEVTAWRFAALVATPDDGPVSVQCEDCCPDVPPAPHSPAG